MPMIIQILSFYHIDRGFIDLLPLIQVTVYNRMTLVQGNPISPATIPILPPAAAIFTIGCDFNADDHRPKKPAGPGPGSKSFGLAGLLKPAPKPKAKASADGSKASCGQKGLGNDKSSSDSVSGSGGAPSSRSFFSMLTNLNLVNMT